MPNLFSTKHWFTSGNHDVNHRSSTRIKEIVIEICSWLAVAGLLFLVIRFMIGVF